MAQGKYQHDARFAQTRELVALAAAALLLYWAGNSRIPLWDRDEPRFAEAAREMLATGDLIVPRFNGQLRPDKPILGYYPIAAGMAVFGVNEFGARALAGIFALASLVTVYFLACRILADRRAAFAAAAILAVSPLMIVEAKLCTVDSFLLFLVVLAFTGLWRIYEGPCRRGWKALFWAALALASLVKGPVALAAVFTPVVLLAVLGRDRTFLTRFGWTWGVPLFLVIAIPWVILVQQRTNGEFLRIAFGKHVVARTMGPLESHKGFYGFYIVTLVATFFPWVFFLPGAARTFAKGLRDRKNELFLVAWAIGLIVVLELVQTKMIHYALPVFPALAMIVAGFAGKTGAAQRAPGWARFPAAASLIFSIFIAVASPVVARYKGLDAAVWPLAITGTVLVVGMITWIAPAGLRPRLLPVAAVIYACGIVASVLTAPALASCSPSKPVAKIVATALSGEPRSSAPLATPDVGLFGYQEPSLVFYLRGAQFPPLWKGAADTEAQSIPAAWWPRAPSTVESASALEARRLPRVLVVSGRLSTMLSILERSDYRRAGAVSGFNFAKGRYEEVSVWAARRSAEKVEGRTGEQ